MREIGKENYAGTFDAARNLAVCGRPAAPEATEITVDQIRFGRYRFASVVIPSGLFFCDPRAWTPRLQHRPTPISESPRVHYPS
jgi:hypothetical protein